MKLDKWAEFNELWKWLDIEVNQCTLIRSIASLHKICEQDISSSTEQILMKFDIWAVIRIFSEKEDLGVNKYILYHVTEQSCHET